MHNNLHEGRGGRANGHGARTSSSLFSPPPLLGTMPSLDLPTAMNAQAASRSPLALALALALALIPSFLLPSSFLRGPFNSSVPLTSIRAPPASIISL